MDASEFNSLSKQFPSNSVMKNDEVRKRPEPIVDKPIELRKKSFWTRTKEAIFLDDSGSIGGYIIKDIIVPTIRDTIYDIVTGGLSMALYSTPKATRGRRNSNNGPYISYADYYNDGRTAPRKTIPQADKYRTQFDIRNIPVPSSDIGHLALDELGERMRRYGNASVQDLFDILSIGSAPATMVNYGWNDISSATVEFIRGEWLLRMPKIVQL